MAEHKDEFASQNSDVNDLVKIIFELIKQNPNATYEYLAGKIGKSEATVKRAIAKLKERNQIKRVGADKNGSWEILQ